MSASRSWPKIRAGLIALHVVGMIVLATPSRESMTNKRSWTTANAKAELEAWTGRLDAMGIETTPEELRARLYAAGMTAGTWRDRFAWPFVQYASLTGTTEAWRMFVRPQKHPAELHLDAQIDGEWVPLMRPWDPESTWLRRIRTQNRVRKMLGRFARGFHPDRYRGYARWFATRAFEDFPGATAVRVRLWRYRSPTPEQRLADELPPGHYEHELVLTPEELR